MRFGFQINILVRPTLYAVHTPPHPRVVPSSTTSTTLDSDNEGSRHAGSDRSALAAPPSGGRRRGRKSCLFTPHNEFKRTWDLMMLFVILYYALTTPYRIGFDASAQGAILVFEEVCTVLVMTLGRMRIQRGYRA